MCKFIPDFSINKKRFHKLTIKGPQVKINASIQNYLLKINIENIKIKLFSLDQNTLQEKKFIGISDPIESFVLEKNSIIEKDFIITIFWQHLILLTPLLFKKPVKILSKSIVQYNALKISGEKEIIKYL